MSLPEALRTRLRLPVLAAPLFVISDPDLVIAQCRAGVIGSFPALNARPAEALAGWLERISVAVAGAGIGGRPCAPFAVNQIVHPSNTRLEQDLETCVAYRVPIVITSLHAPDRVVEAVHAYGGIVLHDIVSIRHARRALDAGVDGLICVCAGAGGHTGRLSPFALVRELRRFYDGTLVLSGAIADGASILAAEAMGADLAAIGTAFIATAEARAQADYKAMIVAARAEDIVTSDAFSGIPANYLKARLDALGLDPTRRAEGAAPLDLAAPESDGPKPWRDIWSAGQGVGQIEAVTSVAALVDRLERDYGAARARLAL